MDEFKKPYLILFNAITDAVKMIERGNAEGAIVLLQSAQARAEDAYINCEE